MNVVYGQTDEKMKVVAEIILSLSRSSKIPNDRGNNTTTGKLLSKMILGELFFTSNRLFECERAKRVSRAEPQNFLKF